MDLTIYNKETLIVSPLGGIKRDKITTQATLCRILPNILLQQNYGTTLVHKQEDSETLNWFLNILGTKGNIVYCKTEDDLNKLATISGCGPAYFFAFAQILEDLWIKHGGDPESGKKTIENLFIGSALSTREGKKSFSELISMVASKGGITQKALDIFAEKGLKDITEAGIIEAYIHGNALSESSK